MRIFKILLILTTFLLTKQEVVFNSSRSLAYGEFFSYRFNRNFSHIQSVKWKVNSINNFEFYIFNMYNTTIKQGKPSNFLLHFVNLNFTLMEFPFSENLSMIILNSYNNETQNIDIYIEEISFTLNLPLILGLTIGLSIGFICCCCYWWTVFSACVYLFAIASYIHIDLKEKKNKEDEEDKKLQEKIAKRSQDSPWVPVIGAGDGGKSTFFKMKKILDSTFSSALKEIYGSYIKMNILETVVTMQTYFVKENIDLSNESSVLFIYSL